MLAMTTPRARSRFLLLPQLAEASTVAKAPVLRRYSLARLGAPTPVRSQHRLNSPQATR